MGKRLLLERVEAAKREIADAESHLAKVVQELAGAPRANKTTSSEVLKDAFAKLNAVRIALVDLEALVENDKT